MNEQNLAKAKAAEEEARRLLIKTAVESMQYVAFGNVMKRDLMDKFDLSQEQAEHVLAVQCRDLMRLIRSL